MSKEKSISAALATATCALLGGTVSQAVHAQEEPAWDFNTSLLYYGEDGDRVQDLSISVLGYRTFVDDRILTLGLTADALTGASPNGALPQSVPQTFTQPSGKNSFTTPANEMPLDDTFRDTRVALTANWEQPLGRLNKINLGASASKEFDYMHLGLNAKISRDFNDRNTTLSGGIAFASDSIEPIGGVPNGLTEMRATRDLGNRRGDETKDIFDIVFGVTQVVSQNTVVQVNYSYSDSSGYLSDPYKIVSMVDANGDAVTIVPPLPNGPSHLNFFEHRPDNRDGGQKEEKDNSQVDGGEKFPEVGDGAAPPGGCRTLLSGRLCFPAGLLGALSFCHSALSSYLILCSYRLEHPEVTARGSFLST